MTVTTVSQRSATEAISLFADHVVEGQEHPGAAASGLEYGVFRAAKSPELLDECVSLLNRGGVVALVPASTSESYLEAIVNEVEEFARSRETFGVSHRHGILALPTSGSTGTPKLVAIPAPGVAHFLSWGEDFFGLDASTVSLSLSPWNFDVSLLDTWAVLRSGGRVIAAHEAKLQDTGYVAGLLEEHTPTFVQVVPSTLEALITAVGGQVIDSVENLVLTGGTAAHRTRRAAAELFPNARFHNVYGATEVNDCLVETFTAEEFSSAETLPLGRAINGCEVALGNGPSLTSLDRAVHSAEGELLVRTPWMALGYISSGVLHPLPSVEMESFGELYPMKDRAQWSEGRLTYVGREDRTIKLRGQRINLDEIENAACRTGLAAMACAWVSNSGDAEQLHLAYTAPKHQQGHASGLSLRMKMSQNLPSFAMPNHLHSFKIPFPLNGNGKPDRNAIKTQVESE